MNEYLNFVIETLISAGNEVLRQAYNEYCDGKNIDIQTKGDNSPASAADREAEKVLRALINEKYSDHGIWGEEYGAERLDREYIWILDPLDGTREFLAQKPGQFGLLIGLLQNGKPLTGIISDPISKKIWSGVIKEAPSQIRNVNLKNAVLSCTNPEPMFHEKGLGESFDALSKQVKDMRTGLNCLGFSAVADGELDLAVESSLALHDIAALIPVLDEAGCTAIDFEGVAYRDMVFDLEQADTQKYGMIAASCATLAEQALNCFKGNIS